MSKKVAIFSIFFLAYCALLTHSIVPHSHHEKELEHHEAHHHHHTHNEQNEENTLSLLLAEIVHLPGSTNTTVSHFSLLFKISLSHFIVPVSELSLRLPIVSSSKHTPPFREERIPSFSITNASLRAPPAA
jgi:hypothetical protein